MSIFNFKKNREPFVPESDEIIRLTDLLETAIRDKELQAKLAEDAKQKLEEELGSVREQQNIRKKEELLSCAKTALVHLLAAQRLTRKWEMAPRDEIRDARYNLAILERTVHAKNLGFEVKDKNITEAVDNIEELLRGH